MRIAHFWVARKWIIRLVVPPLLLFSLDAPAFASSGTEEEIRVEHPRCKIDGDMITITYDLVAPADGKYRVNIVMVRSDDPSFQFVPITVMGDIGEGITSGLNKEIHWDYKKDFPQGLKKGDFSFDFYVDRIDGGSWIYYLVGATVAGGAAAVLLLTRGHSETSNSPTLPPPPTRP